MMKYLFIILGISFLAFGSLQAQIDRFIVGSLGGTIANNNYYLIHSIGDLAGTEIANNNHKLIQGYPPFSVSTTPMGIEDFYNHSAIKVFPNPTSGKVTLEGENNLLQNYEIFSSDGRLILEGGLLHTEIGLNLLSTGIYLLKVYDFEQKLSYVGKVIKL